MIELNPEQQRSVDLPSECPPRVLDTITGEECVLLKSADFDWAREMLTDEPDAPRLTDPRTGDLYALVLEERYKRFKAFFEEDPLSPLERTSLLREAGIRAGWDDPVFDDYDDLSSQDSR